MGQWGKERKIGVAIFIPDIDTSSFAPETSNNIIRKILIVDDGGSS